MTLRPLSVRQRLVAETRCAHDALHVHPLLSRLVTPAFSAADYRRTLQVNWRFFSVLEGARQDFGSHEAFSFQPDLDALRRDLADMGAPAPVDEPPLSCSRAGLLGALYVGHGSQFGRASIYGTLTRRFKQQPHAFFGQGTKPAQWRALLGLLESRADAVTEIVTGAQLAFSRMRAFADEEYALC